tara:strand:+ start:141 stop:902 length:762 start_codon:yes stop_codon:yes gene_type:complete
LDLTNLRELEEYFADNFDTMLFPVLSEHYLVAGDLERAERVCDIGLRHNSDSLAGQFLRARVMMAKKDCGEAELSLKKVLGLDPVFLNARVLMAEVQSVLKRPKETLRQSCLDILELDPGNRQAMKGLESIASKPKKKAQPQSMKKSAKKTKSQAQSKTKRSVQTKPSKTNSTSAKQTPKKKQRVIKNPAQKKRAVAQKPATFTLVKVLKNQKLYEEALDVLAVMSGKRGTDKKRITKEIKSIKALLKSGEGA